MNAIEELEKVSDLCGRIGCWSEEASLSTEVLEPIASYLGAETASFRSLKISHGIAKPHKVVTLGIPESVNDAYLTRYHKLDPARRLLERRIARPVFAHPTKFGEWSKEQVGPAAMHRHREEFVRYRKEFLLPNDFYHHVGFCFQDPESRTVLFDFHRMARSPAFDALEVARAHVIANVLHAKATRCRHVAAPHCTTEFDARLSAREIEVAEAAALGLSNKELAEQLEISVRTVENHLRSIFSKLRVTTRTRLAAKLRETVPNALAMANRVA
jgi:DNA-binding CsgD family transcriptional regulator